MKKTNEDKNINSLSEILKTVEGQGHSINKKLPAIEVKKYTKKFRKFLATDNVSFKVGHGVIHGFIGPNGSGKTTVIKAIIGAYIPTSGLIDINGFKAGSIKANQLIGYIPERASFPKHLNTIEYLKAMGELSGLKPKVALERAKSILISLKMEKQARRKPITFSSGMQKKILLAQSLLTDPSILILDEPAANLDPTTRKELFDQLVMLREQGKTILISSHILAELERIIDEATFIYYGEVIFSGKISTFNKQDSNVYVKSTDNEMLKELLVAKKYKVGGDIKNELAIKGLSDARINTLYKLLATLPVRILSFRSNDLQAVYDRLAEKAFKKNKGKQTLGGKSTVKNEKGSK